MSRPLPGPDPTTNFASSRRGPAAKVVFQLRFALAFSAAALVGCKKDAGDEELRYGPAALNILGAQNTNGTKFLSTDPEINLVCDARVTILLGPKSSTPGLLDNWNLRPPATCGNVSQCGYIHVEFLDKEGDLLLQGDQANIAPVFDLSGMDPSKVSKIVARLMTGDTAEPFLQDGSEVSDSWKVRIDGPAGECSVDATGGASASGGASGGADATGGGDPLGGMGGLGGFDGSTDG